MRPLPDAPDALVPAVLLALSGGQLALAAARREPVRLPFAALLASLALADLAWDGAGRPGLAAGAGAWRRSALISLDALAALFAALLARRFLDAPRRAPRLDAPLRGVMVLAGLAVALSTPGTWALGMELVGLVSLVGPPVLLLAAAAAWRGGFAPAAPYLLGHVALLAGLALEASGTMGRAADAGTLAMAAAVSHGMALRGRRAGGADAGGPRLVGAGGGPR